ncbi:MAG: M3 family oligoendopeptidase [Acidobacteriota bacterium]
MNQISKPAPAPTAQDVRWNLEDLYANREALLQDLDGVKSAAKDFAKRYREKVASLSDTALARALKEMESLQDRLGRAYTYAYLNWCTNTEDAERGALLHNVREQYSQIEQELLFFDLEWTQLEDKPAEKLLESSHLSPYKHYLELQRLHKPHLLDESEEKILSEKSVTGRQAWNRFFDELLGAARFQFDDQKVTLQEILAKLYKPDREVRKQAALSLTATLEQHLRQLTYVFNTVLSDKFSDDRLRQYPHWLASRNLSNETSDEAVQALIDAVTGRYDLVARYYRLKRKLTGLEELYDYDRYAPLGDVEINYSWEQAQETVLEAYKSFHPLLESIAGDFFQHRWIDAAITGGKVGGAFSHAAVPSAHPYVLVNFTGSVRDVQTLAHELGHGVHQYLSRKQGVFHSHPPLTLSETASTFGEMLVFDHLMKEESQPDVRLSMLMSKLDDTIATVFRQVALNRFEDQIHTARRSKGELSPDDFSELWMKTQREMFQGSVTFCEHYRVWWSYIPHFLHTPGYVYAYAFGELLVLALHVRYRQEGDGFAQRYLHLLKAGGSDWPHKLLQKLDVDLNQEQFWQQGLSVIEGLISQAENLANS